MGVDRVCLAELSYWVLHKQPRLPDQMEGKKLSKR